jgi:hypothetical protein
MSEERDQAAGLPFAKDLVGEDFVVRVSWPHQEVDDGLHLRRPDLFFGVQIARSGPHTRVHRP